CGELDSSWPTSALERCAHISLDHRTFLRSMSRWKSRTMSQGLRVLLLLLYLSFGLLYCDYSPTAGIRTGGRRNPALRTSGGQHCECCPEGFDRRLQHLADAGDRQHPIE